jgi:hypothetical protein
MVYGRLSGLGSGNSVTEVMGAAACATEPGNPTSSSESAKATSVETMHRLTIQLPPVKPVEEKA